MSNSSEATGKRPHSPSNKSKRGLSRRDFLKGAATGATALAFGAPVIIPSSALGAAHGQIPPSDRVVLGAIGVRGQGWGDTSQLMSKPGVQCVALCDVDTKIRMSRKHLVEKRYAKEFGKGTYKGCAIYNDFRELLARDDIDAVMIATPDHWHATIAVAAAKSGKDIYCEKPLTLTIDQGKAIVKAVDRYDRIFQVGSQQRSDQRFRFACELVQNGRLGKLKTIQVGIPTGGSTTTGAHPFKPVPEGFDYNMWLGPAPWVPYAEGRCHWNFRYNYDYSGGMVTDWGAHHLDIAQWGNGTPLSGPVEVEGKGDFPTEGIYNIATNYRFFCTYANGVKLDCWNLYPRGVRFIGSEGWVLVRRGFIDAHPKSLLTTVIRPEEIHLYESDDHHGNFIDCVRSRKETVAPAEIGHRSATVCHLGNIAMRLGRKLKWDPVKENFGTDEDANRMLFRAMRAPWRV